MSARAIVRSFGGALAVAALLSSAALRGQTAEPWSFVVLGHLRGDSSQPPRLNPMLPEVVERCRQIRPALVVLTGDAIWGDYNGEPRDAAAVEAEWAALDAELAKIGAPVHRTPGNHEISNRATRDVFAKRYGLPPKAFVERGCLFVLLNSAWIPGDDDAREKVAIRGAPVDASQAEVLRGALEAHRDAAHAFVFLHHLLWWDEDSGWWSRVHPLLKAAPVRAVFGGDYGPKKWSHLRRDGIDYLQSGIETDPGLDMLRINEDASLLSEGPDLFVEVRIDGAKSEIIPHLVGALSESKHEPSRWRAVHETPPLDWVLDHTFRSTRRPRLLAFGFLGLGFAAGALFTTLLFLLLRRLRRLRR